MPSNAAENSIPDRCDVLLLSVNDKEWDAIADTFRDAGGTPPQPQVFRGMPFLNLGELPVGRVVAVRTNMGSATHGGSANVTSDAINKFHPKWIIAVGVAFGMDRRKTHFGDILVSSKVSCYEPERIGENASIRRGASVDVHQPLKAYLQNVAGRSYWSLCKVHFGEILSGEKLIDNPQFKGQLHAAYPEAIGGEMEAAGIYSAAFYEQVPWIVVKAVCDFADGKKGRKKTERQERAAANAVQFVRHCLTAYELAPAQGPDGSDAKETRVPGTHTESAHTSASEPLRTDAPESIPHSPDLVPPLREPLVRRPTADASPANPNEQATALWKEKLAFFLAEQARMSDSEQKFNIGKRIDECRERLSELGAPQSLDPTQGDACVLASASERTPGVPEWTPGPEAPAPIHADALSGIAESLRLVPQLREALAQRLAGDAAAPAPLVAERLCPGEGDAFMNVLSAFRTALADAARALRQRAEDPAHLHERAHDILGWMVVTTVLDGYGTEEAPAVRAWFQGQTFHVPIGRSVCLEVLSARWLRRAARFGSERSPYRTGEDDITPEHPGEVGFDDPMRIDQRALVNEVWRLIYQKVYARTAPLHIDPETCGRLHRRLEIQFREHRRRLRLVLDPADLHNPLNIPAALRAIGEAIPRLHLIVVGAGGPAAEGVFLLPASDLGGDIEECLDAISRVRPPSSQTTRVNP